jgi:hypothetical protein
MHCEEITVTRNTKSAVENIGSIGKSRRSELESSSYGPTAFELAEAFVGRRRTFSSPATTAVAIRLFE